MNVKCCFLIGIIGVSFIAFACAEKETEPGTTKPVEVECTEEPKLIYLSAESVDRDIREMGNGNVFEGMGVRALRGCESLEGPLAALNWWTVLAPEENAAYDAVVGPLVFNLGAKIIYNNTGNTVLMQPEGTTPEGTAWVQEKFVMPLYPSAEAFAGMITSEEWLSVGAYKMSEALNEDYDFVFQKCFYGCEAIQTNHAFMTWPAGRMMVHLLNGSQAQVQQAIEPLRSEIHASGLGLLYFVGYSWALPAAKLEGADEPINSDRGFWNDATLLIHIVDSADPPAILELSAYQDFLQVTSNNTIVVFP